MLRIDGGLRAAACSFWSASLVATVLIDSAEADVVAVASSSIGGVRAESSFFLLFRLWRPIKGGIAPYGFGAWAVICLTSSRYVVVLWLEEVEEGLALRELWEEEAAESWSDRRCCSIGIGAVRLWEVMTDTLGSWSTQQQGLDNGGGIFEFALVHSAMVFSGLVLCSALAFWLWPFFYAHHSRGCFETTFPYM